MGNKDKTLKHFYDRKKNFLYQQTYENLQCQLAIVYNTRLTKLVQQLHLVLKNLFLKLVAKKLNIFINVSDSKDNGSNVNIEG